MGQFEKDIRHKKIAGPNSPAFIRSEWEYRLNDTSLDEDDKRLLQAGLFFDKLLCFLRHEKKLDELPLAPQAIIRLVIAIATHDLFQITEESNTKSSSEMDSTTPSFTLTNAMQETVKLSSGNFFSPDELISGAGDGMKHILRELLKTKSTKEKLTENQADSSTVESVAFEFNKAIIYQCAVEYWNDCIGNGYGLEKHPNGVALVPTNRPMEISRTVSTYRRLSIALQDTMNVNEQWFYVLPRNLKKQLCEIQLVSRIYGRDRIERIDLGLNNKALANASSAVAAKLWLKSSYYRLLLNEPLPNYSGFTLNQIILAWQLLQSLSIVIFDSLKTIPVGDTRSLLLFAPIISRNALRGAFAKALSLNGQQADLLIKVLVFDQNHKAELWFHPLVSHHDDLCLVIPCIHSVHLQRIVEGWMRNGGLELDRRGPEFEKFCIADLTNSLNESPIKKSVQILDKGLIFRPPNQREEEIDIVIIIADTILLIEAKCILWPDEALQFANYRDTVHSAVAQIIRKREAISKNYSSFFDKLNQLGYIAPEKCNLVCCVLTNSAIFSGFPINGIPIVDLSILGGYFKNEHVKLEVRHKGKSIQKSTINFYTDAKDAGEKLYNYLSEPPQLRDTKRYIKKREIVFPVENSEWGKLIHETYSVQIDADEMKKIYTV